MYALNPLDLLELIDVRDASVVLDELDVLHFI